MEHCASCHGDTGQGVDEEYDEPLYGNKSVESLARYIHRSMPEDKEDTVIDDDAGAVAQYIYDAFYGPAAQARLRPPRVELLRLTNNQYRQSVADLVGSFGPRNHPGPERGLRGRFFNSEKMAKEKEHVLDRVDPQIDFDWGDGVPAEGIKPEAFAVHWSGSVLTPHTGTYEFRLRTHNGALLHVNSFTGKDSENAFIDAYVSTGNTLREETGRKFLLGGRAYPIYLLYFSYEEKHNSIHLEWKPPHGVWEAIPTEHLSPHRAAPVTVVKTPFSADDRSLGYERGSAVSKDWQEATTMAAIETVNHIITHLRVIGQFGRGERGRGRGRGRGDRDEGDGADRLREFCHQFAERAFRRPLTPEQRKVFVDSRFADGVDPETATKHSLLLVLTSPRFLYPGLADNEGAPDGYTVAARLALTLWDSLPDEPLRRAARENKLRTPEQVRQQANRMLQDPRSRQKMREFFHHWLAMDEREDLGKDPKLYPGFDERIIADLRTSLERFVDEVVWTGSSDYRQLLLADYLYLNPRLAEFYQAPVPEGSAFVKTPAPGGRRTGVFTHPFLLAANAYHDNTSPIHRGVFLSKHVMGRLLKPPPAAVAFKNEEFDPTLTMREKVTQLTKKESCMQCHRVINPIGFSLENFDAVGRFRTEDNKKPVNTVSDYVNDRDEQIRLQSAKDLANLAVNSEAAHRAFITHLFHHLTKQSTEAYGSVLLDSLRGKFADSGYNIRQLLVETASTAALHDPAAKPAAGPTAKN